MNAFGRGLRRLGLPLLPLEAEGLMAAARRRTNLDDFGEAGFQEGFEQLLESLEEEAALHPLGRAIVRGELRRNLETRLRLVDVHRRHPEIADGAVRRPIVIVGMGRTGTSILHELMALDPANRVPLSWEVEEPLPPPERASYESDPRIERTQRTLDRSEQLIPDFKRMHRMGARLPQECVRITSLEFASMLFVATWRVPAYTRWLLTRADMGSAYATHRRMLQLLQWRCPAERWVLKSPGHLWCLDALVREYPDACLVQTHRDPLKVLSSLTSLEVVLRAMASDRLDASEIAREWSDWNVLAYERSVDFRERGGLPPSQVVDVQFGEFMSDPLAATRRIYAHFGLELRPEVEARMRAYLASNPEDRDGRHVHHFADTGLDPGDERARVKRYQEYFDVPSEERL